MTRALVVDNNVVILKTSSHTQQSRGLKVHTARDGLPLTKILEYCLLCNIFTEFIMASILGESLCLIISARNRVVYQITDGYLGNCY